MKTNSSTPPDRPRPLPLPRRQPKMRTVLSAALLIGLLLCVSAALKLHAQTIDFEHLPDGSVPSAGMQISNQFAASFGVSFRMENGQYPRIAKRDNSSHIAFWGPPSNRNPNRPHPNQNVGDFFLTGDVGMPSPPVAFVITYEQPVSAASGILIDVDWSDSWLIVARDSNTNGMATNQLTRYSANAGGAYAAPWSFSRTNADIASIRLSCESRRDHVGWALDTFSPALPFAPAKLSISRGPNDGFTYGVAGTFGRAYQVEYCEALPPTNWQRLANITLTSAPQQYYVDATASNSVARFYRAVVLQGTAVPTNMALIPAGSFTMGDSIDPSEGDNDELPLHTVYVSAFYMDRTEVTKALWDEVYQWAVSRPAELLYSFEDAGSAKAANHPVHLVNWYDVVKWCNARSERESRVPAYYTGAAQTTVYRTGRLDVENDWVRWDAGYRLPTEAEWEYAARGGLEGKRFPWGDTISHSQANYYSYWEGGKPYFAYDVSPTEGDHPTYATGDEPYTSPVGSFGANGYGLYDMAGNVWEWCWDWYSSGYYGASPSSDPRGPVGDSVRVFRGGGWAYIVGARACRVSDRDYDWQGERYGNLGFRSVLPPGQ